jgi:hydroxymethylbilane synthase
MSNLPHIYDRHPESRLALWQAEHVKALLEQLGHQVTLLGMTTRVTRFWTAH